MKRLLLSSAAMLSLVSAAHSAEYIVKYKEGAQPMFLQGQMGIQMLDSHEKGNLVKLSLDENKKTELLSKVISNPNVEYAIENFKLRRLDAPFALELLPQALRPQWALKKVRAEEAWQKIRNRTAERVTVAVIDTGVDYNHESLKENMISGYDFKDNDSDPQDETGFQNPGHGTHCAGIVGATGEVDQGIIGISPELNLMPLRFLGADGSGDLMAGIKAIDYAIENGADVISASWGAAVSESQARPLIEAVKRASDAGVIFVSAAGNDGRSNDSRDMYPANAQFANTVTVAASDENDGKPSWSNFGKAKVDVAAPGNAIMSTLPKNSYGNLSGTSMATPLVAGLIALMKSQDPELSGLHAKAILQHTGAKVSIESACDCRVDAASAIESVINKTAFVAPAAETLKLNETQKFDLVNGTAPFTFASTQPEVASISADGVLTALKVGQTQVTVTDANGNTAQSLSIYVSDGSDGGGGGGGDNPIGSCPIGDQALCDAICQFMPDLPFCSN